jgi:hypothetical protein
MVPWIYAFGQNIMVVIACLGGILSPWGSTERDRKGPRQAMPFRGPPQATYFLQVDTTS